MPSARRCCGDSATNCSRRCVVYDQFFKYATADTGEGYSAADIGAIEGSSVESWEWTDDMTLVMNIRQGAVFARTGREVTADDFIYWYERALGDAVIDELAVTLDADRKAELAQDYQTLLIEDAPALYLAGMPFEIAMRDSIQGYVQLPDNLLWCIIRSIGNNIVKEPIVRRSVGARLSYPLLSS